MTLMMWMPGWHAAFALQSWLGPRRVADSVVRIEVDPGRALEAGPFGLSSWGRRSPTAVEVPVLVTRVPPGMGLQSDRVAAAGETPDGRAWTTAWDSINRLTQIATAGDTVREDRILPGDDAWLYFNVDRSLRSPERTLPGRIRANAALTLLTAEEITPLQTGGRPTRVPMGGLCWVASVHNMDVICSWPAPMPGYAVIRILSNGTPAGFDIPLLSALEYGSVSYGPCSNAGGLWQVAAIGGTRPGPSEIVLVTRRVVAHFERGVDIYRAGGWPLQR